MTSDRVPLEVNEKYNFFNPKAGLTYEINDGNSLYISYARANREPSRSDFESNININSENFCCVPFFKKAERIAITKSSLLVAIIFNTQIIYW